MKTDFVKTHQYFQILSFLNIKMILHATHAREGCPREATNLHIKKDLQESMC
jgi:hypothetical protein